MGLVNDQIGIRGEKQNRCVGEVFPGCPIRACRPKLKTSYNSVSTRPANSTPSLAIHLHISYKSLFASGETHSFSRALLVKPCRFLIAEAGAGLLGRETFAALKLSESPLDFLMDQLPISSQEGFFLVEHLDGALHEFIDRLIRAALNILFDQFLDFRLKLNGHRGTISHTAVAVNFMMAEMIRSRSLVNVRSDAKLPTGEA